MLLLKRNDNVTLAPQAWQNNGISGIDWRREDISDDIYWIWTLVKVLDWSFFTQIKLIYFHMFWSSIIEISLFCHDSWSLTALARIYECWLCFCFLLLLSGFKHTLWCLMSSDLILQFEPAPRRGEPDVTRRTPDYFLWCKSDVDLQQRFDR